MADENKEIKDFTYQSELGDDMVSKNSILNEYKTTDSIEYDQKFETAAMSTQIGNFTSTNAQGSAIAKMKDGLFETYTDSSTRTSLFGPVSNGLGFKSLGTGGAVFTFYDKDLRQVASLGNAAAADTSTFFVYGELGISDGITAPSTASGLAKIYVDVADGDLKVKFGDGTVKTIATDS